MPYWAHLAPQLLLISAVAIWIVYVWVAVPRRPKSGFRVRESDRGTLSATPPAMPDVSASAHALLGVSPQATRREIQRAFRSAMKRWHPDRRGPEGVEMSRRLIAARDELLKK